MDKNVRRILCGMSTAGLILAGSLPLMAESGWSQCSVGTRAKSAKGGAKEKDKAAAKKVEKTKAPAAKAKTEPVKTK